MIIHISLLHALPVAVQSYRVAYSSGGQRWTICIIYTHISVYINVCMSRPSIEACFKVHVVQYRDMSSAEHTVSARAAMDRQQ